MAFRDLASRILLFVFILPLDMLRSEQFWKDEGESPLLARNFKFITHDNIDMLTARVSSWADLIEGVDSIQIDLKQADLCKNEEFLRIFLRDAERTYVPKDEKEAQERTLKRHAAHTAILKTAVAVINDYHQGLGYIAAFLGLFLDQLSASRIILALHTNSKYSQGYFSATPQRFVADARVLNKLLSSRKPALHAHLASKGVLPEMYATKWFVGLCLHVLPFGALFEFYEAFLTQGNEFLFKFGLAYFDTFEKELMNAKDTHSIMTILRAEDPKCDWKPPHDMIARHEKDDLFGGIVRDALSVQIEADLETLRQLELTLVAEAVERAKKRDEELKQLYSDDEIVFSDEEDD